jgi:hypothetical protein
MYVGTRFLYYARFMYFVELYKCKCTHEIVILPLIDEISFRMTTQIEVQQVR